jgi:acyl carrier protein
MLTMTTSERVLKVLHNYEGIDASQVTGDNCSLTEALGLDSLDALELCFFLEEEFGITIDETNEAPTLQTFGDVVAMVERKLSETVGRAA